MLSAVKLWRSELVMALSTIRDFPESPEDREERMMLAYAGYRIATYHDLKLPYVAFKDTINLAFKRDAASDDLLVLMKVALGIDVEDMPDAEV